MLFNSYSYEILYEQFHLIYLQGDIKLLLATVNNRLKFEIEIVLDLSCHAILLAQLSQKLKISALLILDDIQIMNTISASHNLY